MSTEPRKIYKRRAFDPDIHCGNPKDRSEANLLERRAGYQAKLSELEQISRERELKVQEKIRFKKQVALLAAIHASLAKLEKYGPDDRPCMQRKGFGTTHPGVNLCKFCCECNGRQDYHFQNKLTYSPKKQKMRVAGLMDEMARANHDLLDMEPMLMMLHAKAKDFVAQKGDDLDPESIKSVTLLTEQIRKTIDSMNDKRFKASISVDMYNLVLFKMGEVLMRYVTDQELLDKITDGWSKIAVEEMGSKRNQALISAHGRSD